MAELLQADRLGGGRVRKVNREDDKIVVSTTTDVEPLVEANKRAYNDAPERFGDGTFHKVASFPADVLEAAARNAGLSWREFMDRRSDAACKAWELLLNARELRSFRTRPGYVRVKQR